MVFNMSGAFFLRTVLLVVGATIALIVSARGGTFSVVSALANSATT